MDQLIIASLSHTHYWYEVGMLKVPAIKVTRIGTFPHIKINKSKADSYAYEKLIRKNRTNPFFSGFFNLVGTRMVQIRMAKSV